MRWLAALLALALAAPASATPEPIASVEVVRDGARWRCRITDDPPVNRHRPSVDVMFHSVIKAVGKNCVAAILTGMGDDGARCMGEMRAAGALTLAQDEASSVVYGMPREAVAMGSAVQTVALDRMAAAIMSFARRHRAGAGT